MIARLLFCSLLVTLTAAPLNHLSLQRQLDSLAHPFSGRVGICVQDQSGMSCVREHERFSLQSVMKLLVGFAVLDAVDHQGWRLDESVLIKREDLSLYVQPIAKLVTAQGYRTTVGDLVRRAVVDSDSAAADILLHRLGGPPAVGRFLANRQITGVRLDRDERHLQTEIAGIEWRPEYIDPTLLDRAIQAIQSPRRTAAYQRYQRDPRDTATPRGMAQLLQTFATGKLLSPASTAFLREVLLQTKTFPDRLKAGVAPGWTLGHKTGSSGSWQGVTAATNDVGILAAPDGVQISVVVFIADSTASSTDRAALMANVTRLITRNATPPSDQPSSHGGPAGIRREQ